MPTVESAAYETLVRIYIAPGLGSKQLDRLQVRDVQGWLRDEEVGLVWGPHGDHTLRARRNIMPEPEQFVVAAKGQ
jgi:hypothetical protein